MNNIAWARATAAESELRNGREALEFAQRALRSGDENAVVLRTLAAAQAENAQYAEAAATAERAEKSAEQGGDRAMAENLRRCVEIFRRGEPLHITQGSR